MLALLLVGCQGDIPPVAKYAVVFGRVYDATTNAPLAGVTVTVDAVDVATTASDGTYRVDTIPIGPTDVVIGAPPGYAVGDPSILSFSVRAGDQYRLDVPLKAN
jgi:hypothetical protein